MAAEYWLRRADGRPFGSFAEAQALIRREFPAVEFSWSMSGAELIRLSEANGSELTPDVREPLEGMPSVLEGHVEGAGYSATFNLGVGEPVTCLRVTPRGVVWELHRGLKALEAEAGAEFTWADDE
jgi:hypothetical protein